MLIGCVGPVEVYFYWSEDYFGNFNWPTGQWFTVSVEPWTVPWFDFFCDNILTKKHLFNTIYKRRNVNQNYEPASWNKF